MKKRTKKNPNNKNVGKKRQQQKIKRKMLQFIRVQVFFFFSFFVRRIPLREKTNHVLVE